jgi:(1->4)-alpha-D-glucan 1-alpha-D-glucosylmutase
MRTPLLSPRNAPEADAFDSQGISECLDRLASRKEHTRPAATYRFQFNQNFRFADALRLVPYLKALGVSTCYASPILAARAGSTHGYDITDHNRINPEIGTEEELNELCAELHENKMGLLLDVVPNHMGVGYGTNPWWTDVLQNGRTSKFADYFDIDWEPLKAELRNKVLIPILGNQYGEELEAGHLKLSYNNEGEFRIEYYDTLLPIDPQTIPLIFKPMGEPDTSVGVLREFLGLLSSFADLPPHDAPEGDRASKRQRELPFLQRRLQQIIERSPEAARYVEEAVVRMNGSPGNPRSFDALHQLLEAQAYRVAHWRVSAEEINYRRFFDINDLVGLRMEDPRVFAATQGLIRRLLATGGISGLRVDHPDGLFNPPQYFTRLQMLYAASQCSGAEPRPPLAENGIEVDVQTVYGEHDWSHNRAPLYVVVEKILQGSEELPREWPVDGTVGYEFANLMTTLFVQKRNERQFTAFYRRFIGQWIDVDTVIYDSKKLITHAALSSEINVLSHMLEAIASRDRNARDFTRKALTDAIRETIACFPVYRTYIDERGNITEHDRRYIHLAIATARRRNGSMPGPVLDFLREILLLRGSDDDGTPVHGYRSRLYFTLKFQQLTGPVMAKGLEDTSCYVYNRFVAVNDVGGSPAEFGISVDDFHSATLKRAAEWPFSMLTTSTHDSKRSEDVRMRLAALSEMPRQWAAQALRWRRVNRNRKQTISDGRAVPDLNEEYLLYQTLLGTWPMPEYSVEDPSPSDFELRGERLQQYLTRIQQYMMKAINEAKVNLSWINPNAEYSEAMERFIARILTPARSSRPNSFPRLLCSFLPRVAFFGVLNSLAQTLVKLTMPGVPDIYQGQELLEFNLVDPDNRRPVDFDTREKLCHTLAAASTTEQMLLLCDEMMRHWVDGRAKMWVTMRALNLRRERLPLLQHGSYVPLQVTGRHEPHVVAFARVWERQIAVVAIPRFGFTLMNEVGATETRAPLAQDWGDTRLSLPPQATNISLRNQLTGEDLQPDREHSLSCEEVLRHFPVALLTTEL